MFRQFSHTSITKYNATLNGETPASARESVELWRVFYRSGIKSNQVFTKGDYHFTPTLSHGVIANYQFTVTRDFVFFGYIDPRNQAHMPALMHLLTAIGEKEAYQAGCYFKTTSATNPACALYILTNNLTLSFRHGKVNYYHVIASRFLAKGEYGQVYFIEGTIKPECRLFGEATYFPASRKRLVKDQQFKDAQDRLIRRTQNEVFGVMAADYLKARDDKLLGKDMLPCSKNPNYYSFYRAEANFIFTMKYLNGDTLEKVYEKHNARPLSEHFLYSLPGRLSVAISLLTTLHALHQKGVIYCDLNLGNILIVYDAMTGAPAVRIVDFGLSLQKGKRQHDSWCGSPLFLAPEVLRNNRYSVESDIYGVALIMGGYILGQSTKLDAIDSFGELMKVRKRTDNVEFDLLAEWHPVIKEKLTKLLVGMTQHSPDQRSSLLSAITALEIIRREYYVTQTENSVLRAHLSQNHLLALQYRVFAKPKSAAELEYGLRQQINKAHHEATALQLFICTLGIQSLLHCDSKAMLLEVVSFHVTCYRLAEQMFRDKLAALYQLQGKTLDEARFREYVAYSEAFLQKLQRQDVSLDTLIAETDHILSRVDKLDHAMRRL